MHKAQDFYKAHVSVRFIKHCSISDRIAQMSAIDIVAAGYNKLRFKNS